MKLSTNSLQAIGLLEVLTSHIIVKWLVSRLESTRGPRYERKWIEKLLYQELLRGGEVLMTFLT